MLQALREYGSGLDSEPGFKTREVRWCIELAADGRFLNVLPLGDGKRGQMQTRCPDMHNMNAGGKAHFLVESAQTVARIFKAKEERKKIASTKGRHEFYVAMLREASQSIPVLLPLANALENRLQLRGIRKALQDNKAKPGDWLIWRVGESDPRAAAAVQAWWREWRRMDLGDESGDSTSSTGNLEGGSMVCLLTGESVQPIATQPKITGLSGVGGLAMGDAMVSFDKPAFGSYGLDQSANAAMRADAAQQYIDGLNDLIRNHSRKLANSLVVHWFKEQVTPEDDPLEWLNGFDSQEQTEAAAQAAARRVLDAIRSGERAALGDNRYYALTLSGASGRVMVRDWMEGRFENLIRNIEAWFSDLAIVKQDGKGLAYDPKFYRACLALVRNDRSKAISKNLEQLPAPVATTLWKVAVQCLPIPKPFMAQALARFRADIIGDEPFDETRVGLIKAYFVRLNLGGRNTMTAYLNPDHPAASYHCGRLMAVLAELQYSALGDVGAGVVQRYYAAASQTPGLILGRLIRNAQNHLNKPEKAWTKTTYEKPMMDIISRLKDNFPRILDLEGQGLFALGYYQQLAALRRGNVKGAVITDATDEGEAK